MLLVISPSGLTGRGGGGGGGTSLIHHQDAACIVYIVSGLQQAKQAVKIFLDALHHGLWSL